jgi:prolipoprotein diacylglyceryltransferase
MLPALVWRVGDLHVTLSLYATALATGVAVGLLVALRCARRPEAVLVLAPLAVGAGTGGAAAWHAVVHATPGLSSMGGIAAGLATLAVGCRVARVSLLEVLDAIAPGAITGFAIGRCGCFLGGCCYGRPTTLALGVVFPELGPPARHAAQLYEAAADVVVAWWCARAPTRVAGGATARGLVGYGVVRLLLDLARDPDSTDRIAASGPSLAQLCALGFVVLGFMVARSRARPA